MIASMMSIHDMNQNSSDNIYSSTSTSTSSSSPLISSSTMSSDLFSSGGNTRLAAAAAAATVAPNLNLNLNLYLNSNSNLITNTTSTSSPTTEYATINYNGLIGVNATDPYSITTESRSFGLPVGVQLLMCLLYGTLAFAAVASNMIVCYIVLSNSKMRTATNYFIVNLAVGDILMALLCIPFTFPANLIFQYWPFGFSLCVIVSYSQANSVFISAYTMVAISIDKYIAIMYPMRLRMPKLQAKIIILVIWSAALVTSLPTALLSSLTPASPDSVSATSPQPQLQPPTPTLTPTQQQASAPANGLPSAALFAALQPEASLPTTLKTPALFDLAQLTGQLDGSPTPPTPNDQRRPPTASTTTTTTSTTTTSTSTMGPPAEMIMTNSEKADQNEDNDHDDDDGQRKYFCQESWSFWPRGKYYYSMALMVLQFVLPLFVLVITYSRIVIVVWGKRMPGEEDNARDTRMARSKRKMIKMVIFCVIAFALTWLPFNALIVIGDMHPEIWEHQSIMYIWFITHYLAMCHTISNPLIYIWMNNRFRAGFKQVIGDIYRLLRTIAAFLLCYLLCLGCCFNWTRLKYARVALDMNKKRAARRLPLTSSGSVNLYTNNMTTTNSHHHHHHQQQHHHYNNSNSNNISQHCFDDKTATTTNNHLVSVGNHVMEEAAAAAAASAAPLLVDSGGARVDLGPSMVGPKSGGRQVVGFVDSAAAAASNAGSRCCSIELGSARGEEGAAALEAAGQSDGQMQAAPSGNPSGGGGRSFGGLGKRVCIFRRGKQEAKRFGQESGQTKIITISGHHRAIDPRSRGGDETKKQANLMRPKQQGGAEETTTTTTTTRPADRNRRRKKRSRPTHAISLQMTTSEFYHRQPGVGESEAPNGSCCRAAGRQARGSKSGDSSKRRKKSNHKDDYLEQQQQQQLQRTSAAGSKCPACCRARSSRGTTAAAAVGGAAAPSGRRSSGRTRFVLDMRQSSQSTATISAQTQNTSLAISPLSSSGRGQAGAAGAGAATTTTTMTTSGQQGGGGGGGNSNSNTSASSFSANGSSSSKVATGFNHLLPGCSGGGGGRQSQQQIEARQPERSAGAADGAAGLEAEAPVVVDERQDDDDEDDDDDDDNDNDAAGDDDNDDDHHGRARDNGAKTTTARGNYVADDSAGRLADIELGQRGQQQQFARTQSLNRRGRPSSPLGSNLKLNSCNRNRNSGNTTRSRADREVNQSTLGEPTSLTWARGQADELSSSSKSAASSRSAAQVSRVSSTQRGSGQLILTDDDDDDQESPPQYCAKHRQTLMFGRRRASVGARPLAAAVALDAAAAAAVTDDDDDEEGVQLAERNQGPVRRATSARPLTRLLSVGRPPAGGHNGNSETDDDVGLCVFHQTEASGCPAQAAAASAGASSESDLDDLEDGELGVESEAVESMAMVGRAGAGAETSLAGRDNDEWQVGPDDNRFAIETNKSTRRLAAGSGNKPASGHLSRRSNGGAEEDDEEDEQQSDESELQGLRPVLFGSGGLHLGAEEDEDEEEDLESEYGDEQREQPVTELVTMNHSATAAAALNLKPQRPDMGSRQDWGQTRARSSLRPLNRLFKSAGDGLHAIHLNGRQQQTPATTTTTTIATTTITDDRQLGQMGNNRTQPESQCTTATTTTTTGLGESPRSHRTPSGLVEAANGAASGGGGGGGYYQGFLSPNSQKPTTTTTTIRSNGSLNCMPAATGRVVATSPAGSGGPAIPWHEFESTKAGNNFDVANNGHDHGRQLFSSFKRVSKTWSSSTNDVIRLEPSSRAETLTRAGVGSRTGAGTPNRGGEIEMIIKV